VKKQWIFLGVLLAIVLTGAWLFFSADSKRSESAHHETTATHNNEKVGSINMSAVIQKENGVIVAAAEKQQLINVISATGKVEANADRVAHVSPRISGKIVSVKASLGDSVTAGQTLVSLNSVELLEAFNRYHLSKTKIELAESNMKRVRYLVDKKIAARKDILQAETDYKIAQTELHSDEERLSLFGVPNSDMKGNSHKKTILPVRSPISGIITEKHAIAGELSEPSKTLFSVVDLSSVWVSVDINEKDLAKIHNRQQASITVGAYPDLKFNGMVTYIADQVNESSRTVKARVELANPGRKLKPEMFASVKITLPASVETTLVVPEDAVQEIDGNKVIFLTDDKGVEFKPQKVVLGRTGGGMVEVISGLQEHGRYAVKGSFILKSELKKSELEGDAH
jgi:cobalt-zinc-cadmium efflux system membrane fusion protein